jgi:sec-independent protein translocase protein TatA
MSSALGFLGNLHFGEILIIVLIVLLLFGSAKIPALMKSMGSGINQFKKGLKEGEKEAEDEAKKAAEEKPSESEKK